MDMGIVSEAARVGATCARVFRPARRRLLDTQAGVITVVSARKHPTSVARCIPPIVPALVRSGDGHVVVQQPRTDKRNTRRTKTPSGRQLRQGRRTASFRRALLTKRPPCSCFQLPPLSGGEDRIASAYADQMRRMAEQASLRFARSLMPMPLDFIRDDVYDKLQVAGKFSIRVHLFSRCRMTNRA